MSYFAAEPHVEPAVSEEWSSFANSVGEFDSDLALVRRAKAGEQQAFSELVRRYQARAENVALGLLKNEQDAREIVQEAFLRVYRRLSSFEGSSSFFTWLYRIVTNLSIDALRKPQRKYAESCAPLGLEQGGLWLQGGVQPDDPLDSLCRAELSRQLRLSIEALPNYHRGVIVMREFRGLSYEEMAKEMGVSKGTIMSRLFHARQKLQRALGPVYRERFGAPDGSRSQPGGL